MSDLSVKVRLGIMMFLQYAVWGLWLPIIPMYLQASTEAGGLGFTPGQVGWIIGTAGSIGAITAPFIAGQLADRFFATQRFLGFLLFAGGIVIFTMAYMESFWWWLVFSVLYSICYQPTLTLTNSLSFANLKDTSRDFPKIRWLGTVGWIVVAFVFAAIFLRENYEFSLAFPFIGSESHPDATARVVYALMVSGGLSMVYGIYAFSFLPHTPPRPEAAEALAFAKAFRLLKQPSFLVLFITALPISVVLYVYFMQTSPFLQTGLGLEEGYVGPAMSIGQFAEIVAMLLLGLALVKGGFRLTICIGGLAYVLRFVAFGSHEMLPVWLVVSSQALHGFCYAFFFAAAFIYVDRIAPEDIRHSAQTVFGMILFGVGPIVAAPVVWILTTVFEAPDGTPDYSALWYATALIALAATIFFAIFFRDETGHDEAAPGSGKADI